MLLGASPLLAELVGSRGRWHIVASRDCSPDTEDIVRQGSGVLTKWLEAVAAKPFQPAQDSESESLVERVLQDMAA